jgi:hypothetical protein
VLSLRRIIPQYISDTPEELRHSLKRVLLVPAQNCSNGRTFVYGMQRVAGNGRDQWTLPEMGFQHSHGTKEQWQTLPETGSELHFSSSFCLRPRECKMTTNTKNW